jgi:acyl carrier protein
MVYMFMIAYKKQQINESTHQQILRNMDIEEVKTRVKKVIAEVLEMDLSEIEDNANFVNDLGASSLQSIRLIAGFEEEFNIEMDEDKSLQVQTVSEAVSFINTYL